MLKTKIINLKQHIKISEDKKQSVAYKYIFYTKFI